jgi:hypothetical protein
MVEKPSAELWYPEAFQGRITRVTTEEKSESFSVPDGMVLCDICNQDIDNYPVVVIGRHALCGGCFPDMLDEARLKTCTADEMHKLEEEKASLPSRHDGKLDILKAETSPPYRMIVRCGGGKFLARPNVYNPNEED